MEIPSQPKEKNASISESLISKKGWGLGLTMLSDSMLSSVQKYKFIL